MALLLRARWQKKLFPLVGALQSFHTLSCSGYGAVRGKRPLVALQHSASVQDCKGEGDLFLPEAEEEQGALEWEAEQGVRVSGFS